MLFRLIVLIGCFAACALGQSSDIFERLRKAPLPPGQGEAAAAALKQRDFAGVESILSRNAPPVLSQRAELLSLAGAVKFLAGDMAAAIADFDRAAAITPLSDADNFTLAMALVKGGDDARARTILTGLERKHPDSAIYLYWLGRIDYDQRRYQEAVAKLTRASQLDPNSARIWDSLGLAYDMQAKNDQALAALETAVKLNRPDRHPSPWPPHDLGYLLLRMERFPEAEAALRESLRYEPRLAQTHYYLGRTLEKEKKDTEAVEQYEAAVRMDPDASAACYSLAMLYRKLHRETEAAAMFAEYRKRTQR